MLVNIGFYGDGIGRLSRNSGMIQIVANHNVFNVMLLPVLLPADDVDDGQFE